jgi:transposase
MGERRRRQLLGNSASTEVTNSFDLGFVLGEFGYVLTMNTFYFFSEYFRRKRQRVAFLLIRGDGWKIWQRRNDRIETATMCKGVWHTFWL